MFGEAYLKKTMPVILTATAVGIGVSACGSTESVIARPNVTSTTLPNLNVNGPGPLEGLVPKDSPSGGTLGEGGGTEQEGTTPNINYSDPANIVSALTCSISNVENVASPKGDTEVSMNLNISDTPNGKFVSPNNSESLSNPDISYEVNRALGAQTLWKYSNTLSSFAPVESLSVEIPESVSLIGSILTVYDSQQTHNSGNNEPCGAFEYTSQGWVIDNKVRLPGSAWESQTPSIPESGPTGVRSN